MASRFYFSKIPEAKVDNSLKMLFGRLIKLVKTFDVVVFPVLSAIVIIQPDLLGLVSAKAGSLMMETFNSLVTLVSSYSYRAIGRDLVPRLRKLADQVREPNGFYSLRNKQAILEHIENILTSHTADTTAQVVMGITVFFYVLTGMRQQIWFEFGTRALIVLSICHKAVFVEF